MVRHYCGVMKGEDMKNEYTRYTARIPQPVYEWLSRRAEENLRSKNSEFVAVLKKEMEKEQIADA